MTNYNVCPDQSFDWSPYEDGWKGGNHLLKNTKIKTKNPKDKVYSRETYAREFLSKLENGSSVCVNKDLHKGELVDVTGFKPLMGTKVLVEISNGINVLVDMSREKKFVEYLGLETVEAFMTHIKYDVSEILALDVKALVVDGGPSPKISIWDGRLETLKHKFKSEIKNPTTAYSATIVDANKGGYYVDVMGVRAFMPGSLAAANKISDFQSMLGKKVFVMIEDYIKDINSFIVSHKKYIKYALPAKIKELEFDTKYSGVITGTTKFGIFIEFDEFFTGLLHTSKMTQATQEKFNKHGFKVGDEIDFYIDEIKDNRIIITEESMERRLELRKQYIESIKDREIVVTVVNNITSGVLVIHEGYTGLILKESLKKTKMPKLIQGDSIRVILQKVENDKLFFAIP